MAGNAPIAHKAGGSIWFKFISLVGGIRGIILPRIDLRSTSHIQMRGFYYLDQDRLQSRMSGIDMIM